MAPSVPYARPLVHRGKNAALKPAQRVALQLAIDTAEATSRRVAGYPPALQPVSVAQFLLESAWGAADCGGARNYFGIKARGDEPFVERQTREVVRGKTLVTKARFRKFASIEECFVAHALLITTRRRGDRLIYEKAMAHPLSPVAFAHALTGIYATDPEYGTKLVRAMRDRGLLDTFGFVQVNREPTA
ncbi:MAG: glucosaminidase domain-containing protein [Gemmatimonadaceae bacterium]